MQGVYSVVELEPISSKYGKVPGRRRKRNRNERAAPNSDATKCSGSFVHSKRREVEIATDLVFYLDSICEVPPRWDWTVCAIHSILP